MSINTAARTKREENIFFIVDDDHFIVELIKQSIRPYGQTHSFENANTLIEEYKEQIPDIVFLDIHMGRDQESGIALLEKIMAIDPQANVHMLSGDSTMENITNCIRLGARSFIGKPISHGKLIKALQRCPTLKTKGKMPKNK